LFYFLPPGTETNRPPEMVKNGWYDPSKEAVRNIGLIIYEMFYGQFPYTDYINYKTFTDVTAGLPNLDDLPDGKCTVYMNIFLYDENAWKYTSKSSKGRAPIDVKMDKQAVINI
jgi:hypothetical protein